MTEAGGFMIRMKRHSRGLALCAMLGFAPMLTSCYGRFPLTKAVYAYNGDVTDNQVAQSLILWAFAILPVYGGAMLGDAFIFNLIEYWTGKPLQIGSVTTHDGATLAVAPSADGRTATMTLTKGGQVLAQRQFEKLGDGSFRVVNEKGAVVGKVIPTSTGKLQFADANGNVMQTVAPRG